MWQSTGGEGGVSLIVYDSWGILSHLPQALSQQAPGPTCPNTPAWVLYSLLDVDTDIGRTPANRTMDWADCPSSVLAPNDTRERVPNSNSERVPEKV